MVVLRRLLASRFPRAAAAAALAADSDGDGRLAEEVRHVVDGVGFNVGGEWLMPASLGGFRWCWRI